MDAITGFGDAPQPDDPEDANMQNFTIPRPYPSAANRYPASLAAGFFTTLLLVTWLLLPSLATADPNRPWVPGRVLMQAKAGVSEARVQQLIERSNGRAVDRIDGIDVHVIEVPPQAEEAVVRALSRNPHVKFAEKDFLVELSQVIPDDPRYGNAWHLPRIQAPDAWTLSRGQNVVVAVLDTGVDAGHPDLAGKLVQGWNSASQTSDSSDVHGHGTRVAGTVGAATNNATGVASVGWDAMVMPIRVTNRSDGVASSSDMARGLTWAADNGAHVANMSYESWRHSTVASAAQYMRTKGGIVFGAAGNAGTDTGNAWTPYVVVVSATGSNDTRTSWSNYGSYVDLAAPGASIQTTSSGGGYSSVSGTSFSSPVAAAVAALVKAANPGLAPHQIEQILFDSADDLGDAGWDPYYGWGRVNAARAVGMAWSGDADREAPWVEVVSPESGTTVTGEVTVVIAAEDNQGVTEVVLYANGRHVGTETMAPYEFVWDSAAEPEGSASLYAEAYDAAGNRSTHTIDVTVQHETAEPAPTPADTMAPTVQVTAPADGENVSGNVRVSGVANDDVGVVYMDILINGAPLCSSNSGSISCNWNTRKEPSGNHLITLRAQDAAGNVGSASITVQLGGSSSDGGGGGGGGPPPGKGNNK